MTDFEAVLRRIMEARDSIAEGNPPPYDPAEQGFDDWAADLASAALKGRQEAQIYDGQLLCPHCGDGDSLNFNMDVVEIRGVELHHVNGEPKLGVYYGGNHDGDGEDDRLFCGMCCCDLDLPEGVEILWDPTEEELKSDAAASR